MSNPLGNRNLLFGILAVQRNVIGRNALVAALRAWVAAKGKGMAQILREQKAITENQHAILEECVDVHLARHGGDAEKGLAGVCLVGPVRDDVQAIDDPDLRAGLAHVSTMPIVELEPAPVEAVEAAQPVSVSRTAKARRAAPPPVAKSGTPGCVWLVAGVAVGLAVAVVGLGGALVAVVWVVNARPASDAKVEPAVQANLDAKPRPPEPSAHEPVAPEPPEPPEPPVVKRGPWGELARNKPDGGPPLGSGAPAGFEPLFNGQDLAGWREHPVFGGSWQVENGILTGVAGARNYGRLETEKPQPRDFHLRAEVRAIGTGLGHLTFRAPPAARVGYDVTLGGIAPGDFRTGGIILQGPASRTLQWAPSAPIPRGQWFVLEAIVQGSHIVIKVDGQVTTDVTDLTLSSAGHIALGQYTQEPVEYRRIDVKELPPAPVQPAVAIAVTPGFTPLFNGRDLAGWKPHKITPGNWRVENGVLVSSTPGKFGGRLYTDGPQPVDFHLRVETRISDKGSGAVLFRCQDGTIVGYEAPISSTALYIEKTGSLVAQVPGRRITLVRLDEAMATPDQWAMLEIIAQGPRIIVKVNGKTTAQVLDRHHVPNAGHVVLVQNPQSTVEFRKVEIKKLEPVAVAAPPAIPATPLAPAEGFVPLFNGKDLTGWQSAQGQPGNWNVIDGILTGVGGRLNLLYTTRADYADFHLRAQARINEDGFSSLLFRYNHGSAELDQGRLGGYGVRLAGRADDVSKSGSLMAYEKFGMRHLVVKEPRTQPGQWFNLEIIAHGNLVTTKVNGQVAISFLNPKTDLMAGRFVLEASSTNRRTVMEYRKIEIKELKRVAAAPPMPVEPPMPAGPPNAKEGFTPLFNGKDLAGWEAHPKRAGNWRVEKGVLIGSAPAGGSLYSTRGDYQDFHLRAQVRINDQGFGRVFVRAAYDPAKVPFKVLGYEILINQRPLGDKLGTLRATSARSTAATQAAWAPCRAGDWFLLEVVAQGGRVTVSINGKAVAEFADDNRDFARAGHIALHQDANAVVEFRNVEIRALPGAKGGAAGPP